MDPMARIGKYSGLRLTINISVDFPQSGRKGKRKKTTPEDRNFLSSNGGGWGK